MLRTNAKRKKKRFKSLPISSVLNHHHDHDVGRDDDGDSDLCSCPNGSVRRTTGYSLRQVCTECRRMIISPPPFDYTWGVLENGLPRIHTEGNGFPLSFDVPSLMNHSSSYPRLRSSRCLPPLLEFNTVQGTSDEKKAMIPAGVLVAALKPSNQDFEREKFFRSKFMANPQFIYKSLPEPESMRRYNHPSADLLDFAVLILSNTLKRHGTYEKFERYSGGRVLNKQDTLDMAREYLKTERLQDKVFINLSDDLVSRGSMSKVKGRPTLNIRYDNAREHWVAGLLRHEVGTHYLRSRNNKLQIWHDKEKREELDMGPVNPTEEGLASLHSVLYRKEPFLWRASLLYYTAYKAAFMSFGELFQDLGRFVKDSYTRWDYCLRAKRGMTDTSKWGTFCKDQVYLIGALQLLKRRRTLDFEALVRLGKVSYKDVERLKPLANFDDTKIPCFMADEEAYRLDLDKIVQCNGLSDYLLEKVS